MADLYKTVMGASRFLIIGSCVSKQLVDRMFVRNIKRNYLWRMCTTSIASPSSGKIYDFSDAGEGENETKTLENDFNKSFEINDLLEKSDVVVMDFMKDIYDCLELEDGVFATAGMEWEKNPVVRDRVGNARRIQFFSEEAVENWVVSAQRLAECLNRHGKPSIIIENQLAHFGIDNGNPCIIHPEDQWSMKVKGYLMRQYAHIMHCFLDNSVLVNAPGYSLYSTSENEYGFGEGHMSDIYFNGLVEDFYLKANLENKGREPVDRASRERLCNHLLQRLLDHARFGMPV